VIERLEQQISAAGLGQGPTRPANTEILRSRQNNVLFGVLAQFSGPEAINDRLILLETVRSTDAGTTCFDSLDPDQSPTGRRPAVSRQPYLMDYRDEGADARQAMSSTNDAKRNHRP